jgi:hypothetical protein
MRRPKWDKRSELAVKYCCQDPFTGQNRNQGVAAALKSKRILQEASHPPWNPKRGKR